MKSFKSLFIKEDETEDTPSEVVKKEEVLGFKTKETISAPVAVSGDNPYLAEIIQVYEKGLESLNMPGYDFYDFFLVIKAAGTENESVYKMAFQMGKTMDTQLSSQKLMGDADYYVSKLNEVHQNYADQGKKKLNEINQNKENERNTLSAHIQKIDAEMDQLKQRLSQLELQKSQKQQEWSQFENKYLPQQQVIEQKLAANDTAKTISVQKLLSVKKSIELFLK